MQQITAEYIEEVDAALESLRPYLKKDGGDIKVVNVTSEGLIEVKLLGNCEGCPMSFMTMKAGVEETLLSAFPNLKGVRAINGLK